MIWIDDSATTIRIQSKEKTYLKLNDGKNTFIWFYDPSKFSGYYKASPIMLVEWTDDE